MNSSIPLIGAFGLSVANLVLGSVALQDSSRDDASPPALSSHASAQPRDGTRGVFTFSLDNDVLLLKDDNYSAGGGLEWVTGELSGLGRSNVFRQFHDTLDFLPGLSDPHSRQYASVALNYEMYTPEDIEANPPPADQQPYAGIAAFDFGLYARKKNSMNAYGLRLGWVGPATGADTLQKSLHKMLGTDIPQGWDYQLSNEPLINVFHRYQRRIARSAPADGFGYDAMWDVGSGLGNYYTGVAASASFRFGYAVPDYHSVNLIPTTRQAMIGMQPTEDGGFSAFINLYVQGMATLRYLPTDGNTFTDSASIDRDPFSGDVTGGLFLMYERFILGFEIHNANDMFEDDINRNRQFASLRLSWVY